ncbi:MAG: Transcriptional regulator, TetR family [Labilithrix sp.]|nr:Transcriptional regulator, TetR family [Labilithrix sp.]
MPYPAEHKQRTRERIVERARVLFNRKGFDQVSIDDVMKEAGLTRGGFYKHFDSKDELYAAAVESFTTCNPFGRSLEAAAEAPPTDPRVLARMLVALYLSDETLADIDNHCPLIALPSDVARAGLKPRASYTMLVSNLADTFRAALGADPDAERKALLVVSLCVGGMVIARTTDDPALKAAARAAARSQALSLLGD